LHFIIFNRIGNYLPNIRPGFYCHPHGSVEQPFAGAAVITFPISHLLKDC